MEKAFAYICAAQDAAPRLLRRYCHKVYELGYVPICPKLSLPQYLSADVPEEQRAMSQISQQLLDDNAFIYASHLKMSFVMKSNIKGFTAHPSDYYEITSDLEV